MKKLILIIFAMVLLTSCYSDKAKFDYLKTQYPNCDILSIRNNYFAVDTLNNHGAIYMIDFYYGTKICNVNRLR